MRKTGSVLGCLTALVIAVTASSVSAETLLMPPRDFLKTPTSEVVWGITTLANGTAYTLDYGDGSALQAGFVADRSYIAFNHPFLCGVATCTYTVTLTVGVEVATTTVKVFDPAALIAFDLRALNINRAIQDGLRYLWTSQNSRTTTFMGSTASWSGTYPRSMTALATLAFENQGYHVPNNNNAWCTAPGVPAGCNPPGIYTKYTVQRGLNFIMDQLATLTLATTAHGGNPCVGVGVVGPPCTGLYTNQEHNGYAVGIAIMALSGGQAPTRIVDAGLGSNNGLFVAGKTYLEVLQRTVDAYAYGQVDNGTGRGGWYYDFNGTSATGAVAAEGTSQTSDGSTMGWAYNGLIDAALVGVTMPAFVSTEINTFLLNNNALNSDGTYDYRASGSAATNDLPNSARAGTGLMAAYYKGTISAGGPYPTGTPQVDASALFINNRWAGASLGGDYTDTCGVNGAFLGQAGRQNKGCGYAMFNNFKGLKSQGITTLPGVGRAAGPGAIPANDWYADYEDFLVANQNAPTTTAGGQWASMLFSCCFGNDGSNTTSIAELILAPTPFISAGDCTQVGISTTMLPYPLDHSLRSFALTTPTAHSVITAICQDENPNFEAIPAYAIDGAISTNTTGTLRMEFSGTRGAPSNGRVYHIYFHDTTLVCHAERTVIVATTPGGTTAIDGGPLFDSTQTPAVACVVPIS